MINNKNIKHTTLILTPYDPWNKVDQKRSWDKADQKRSWNKVDYHIAAERKFFFC